MLRSSESECSTEFNSVSFSDLTSKFISGSSSSSSSSSFVMFNLSTVEVSLVLAADAASSSIVNFRDMLTLDSKQR